MGGFRNKNRRKKERREREKRGLPPVENNRDKNDKKKERKSWFSGPKGAQPKNPKMEAYYALQGIFDRPYDDRDSIAPTSPQTKESEKDLFLKTMEASLKASFRICQSIPAVQRKAVADKINSFQGAPLTIEVVDEKSPYNEETKSQATTTQTIQPSKSIPFVKDGYQLDVDRKTIRKNTSLKEFHEWLVTSAAAGLVTRQETVSMIPPAVLGVEPHHSVLDLCAAPGSKTTQLLEVVAANNDYDPDNEANGEGGEGGGKKQGYVVANDCDFKRAMMLVTQCKRINSPALMVTCHAGQWFPVLPHAQNDANGNEGNFDRVLCDVPCSGDGTLRKCPQVWDKWSASQGMNLHSLQLEIALRGARLTKVGGYMCYSTCSLNPIENEAVVASILKQTGGSLEIVEVTQERMPGLKRRPGMKSWRVLDDRPVVKKLFVGEGEGEGEEKKEEDRKEGGEKEDDDNDNTKKGDADADADADVDADADADADLACDLSKKWSKEGLEAEALKHGLYEFKSGDAVPADLNTTIRPTVFPPTPEEADAMGLDKCIRCYPQDMDTGGFFVTLFKKVGCVGSPAKAERRKRKEEYDKKMSGGVANDNDNDNDNADESNTNGDNADANADTNTNGNSKRQKGNDSKPIIPVIPAASFGVQNQDPDKPNASNVKNFNPNQLVIDMDEDFWKPIAQDFGFREDFPYKQFKSRTAAGRAIMFFTKEIVEELVEKDVNKKLNLVHCGVKTVEKSNNKNAVQCHRPSQEGAHLFQWYITDKRKVMVGPADFSILLSTKEMIPPKVLSKGLQEKIHNCQPGSIIFVLEGAPIENKMILSTWMSQDRSVSILVARKELDQMVVVMKSGGWHVDVTQETKEEITKFAKEKSEKAAIMRAEAEAEKAAAAPEKEGEEVNDDA